MEFREHRPRQEKMVQDNLGRNCEYPVVTDLQAERRIPFTAIVYHELFDELSVFRGYGAGRDTELQLNVRGG